MNTMNLRTSKALAIITIISTLLFSISFNVMALPKDITRESSTVGGKPAELVFIKMGEGRSAEISIGTGKFYTVDKAINHINRKNNEQGKSVQVALNGGYFDAYTIGYRTYAAIVQNGVLTNGGGSGKKPTLAFTSTGEPLIDRVQIQPKVVLRSNVEVRPWTVNAWFQDPNAVMLFNSSLGATIDIPATSTLIYIENDMVTKIVSGTATKLSIANPGTNVLVYNANAYQHASNIGTAPKIGNSAQVESEITPTQTKNEAKWQDIITAVSAGPMILLGGEDVSQQNDDFTEAKQGPDYVALRTFAAIMNDGRLLLGSATASPKQLASYLLSIGAVDAMSLDGGASTMLYTCDEGFIVSAGRNLSNVLTIVDYDSGIIPSIGEGNDLDTPAPWAKSNIEEAEKLNLVPDIVKGAYKTNITRQDFCHLTMTLLKEALGENKVNSLIRQTGISYDSARAAFHRRISYKCY